MHLWPDKLSLYKHNTLLLDELRAQLSVPQEPTGRQSYFLRAGCDGYTFYHLLQFTNQFALCCDWSLSHKSVLVLLSVISRTQQAIM